MSWLVRWMYNIYTGNTIVYTTHYIMYSTSSTQREDLPQQNSVGPDVALSGVNTLEDALWRHPLHWQPGLVRSHQTSRDKHTVRTSSYWSYKS